MAYFPMFIDLKDKDCLVVGGGTIALRKVETLLDFGAIVHVTAPVICEEIANVVPRKQRLRRSFAEKDLKGMVLVVAATDDPEENHRISELCRAKNIPVNAVDQIEDCTFIFPAYERKRDVVAAFSSGGGSPVIAQYLKQQSTLCMTDLLGEMGDLLANLRPVVKARFQATGSDGQNIRKQVYQKVLDFGLKKGSLPTDEEIEEIISSIL